MASTAGHTLQDNILKVFISDRNGPFEIKLGYNVPFINSVSLYIAFHIN